MAQQTITSEGVVLTVPGTYVAQKVISGQSGFPTAGVITLVGEAAEGPGFSQEENIDSVAFGPDQFDSVVQKYGSGRLVDAYRAIVAPSNDPIIVGAPSAIRFIKTNASTKASATLNRPGIAEYALLAALRGGNDGNLIRYKSEVAQAEVAPSILLKAYTPLFTGTANGSIRINGGTLHSFSLAAADDVGTFASVVGSTSNGIMVAGGQSVASLSGKAGLAITAAVQSGNLLVTLATGQTWAAVPEIGSTAVIPAAGQYGAVVSSAIQGAGNNNLGSYVVLSVTNTASNASMLLKPVNTAGAIQSASGTVDAGEKDLVIWRPVSVYNITGQERDVTDGITADWTTTNDGTNVVITSSVTLNSKPAVGDILKVPALFAGIQPGFYSVTGATSTTVSCFRMSYGSAGTSGSALATTAGFDILKSTIDGLGKTMETVGDFDSFLRNANGTGSDAGDTFYSSSAEYVNRMTLVRGSASNEMEAGGDIILRVGSTSGTASVQITSSEMTVTDLAGSATFSFDTLTTLSDLVDSINGTSGWSATLGSSRFAFVSPKSLDKGTFGASSPAGYEPARIKYDAFDWKSEMAGSTLVSVEMTADSGLPEVVVPFVFLSGGARGATTGADIINALNATKDMSLNFIVTLFSADATTDIATGETDSASTYTIDAINAAAKANVISSSAVKARQNRQAFLSRVGTFAEQQEAAGDTVSFRCSMSFLNVKVLNSAGTIADYQPWMAAVIAAGMQAAAGYRGIVKKFANISGLFHAAGDYNTRSYSQKEQALKAGLLPMEPVNTGGFRFVSDQTTYTLDSNFVFNSIQAVYIADLMTLSLIDAFDRVVVGQSVAEVSATAALSFLEGQMYNFYRLKWTAASNDAPLGYKNASIRIQGGVMNVAVEAKLAGLIYFVPITLSISEVSQEAVQ